MRALWSVAHALESASKRMRARLGVTGQQRLVLRLIGRQPDVSAGELAGILHVHPSTLTGVLQRLADAGLVTRRADPEDGRRSLLGLSAAGRRIDEVRSGTVEAGVRRALARVTPDDRAATERVLRALADELDPEASGPRSVPRR